MEKGSSIKRTGTSRQFLTHIEYACLLASHREGKRETLLIEEVLDFEKRDEENVVITAKAIYITDHLSTLSNYATSIYNVEDLYKQSDDHFVEVYEHDLIASMHNEELIVGEIFYSDDNDLLEVETKNNTIPLCTFLDIYGVEYLIGNRFDTPELIPGCAGIGQMDFIKDDSRMLLRMKSDKPNYSIWITEEKEEDDSLTYDVNVWDEDSNDRVEAMESGHLESYHRAVLKMKELVLENIAKINFIRLSDQEKYQK